MKIQFYITLKEGYKPINPLMGDYEENEISIVVEARNMATANRMVKALFKDAPNVAEIDGGICIED